ncbi:MAG TPA: Sec-independent protein translocase protein TatB [Anaeromyxobacteraceae bacterium]|jgi:sec-independent protein translocase protein TatB|nr:Sec-independent protein translocase protein TatB [Anaeromyxobacteraceae bacterium]
MFGLGFGEILIVLVLALVLLGPQKLPEAAKQLGKGMREFKKATDDLKQQFEKEMYAEDQPAARPTPTLVDNQPPVMHPPVPAGPVPVASAENVPGLDVALADAPAAPSAAPAAPLAAPAAEAAAQPAAPETAKTA